VQAFIEASAAVSAPRPPTTARVVALNTGPFVAAPRPLEPLDAPGDATILDVRSADDYAAGHARGSFNVPVSGNAFATRAGFVLEPDERIVIRASNREQAQRAATGLRSIGFIELAGYVTELDTSQRLEPVELDDLERLMDEGSVQVLDVREKSERDEGYIPGSLHMPFRLLRAAGADGIDVSKPVVTICESGMRASIAASLLTAAGIEARPVIHGGVDDWSGQTVSFRRCGTVG
jgi:rhodanese-related sulfurtransferase